MKPRIFHRVNGSLAIYYEIGGVIASLIALGAVGHWIYGLVFENAQFSWEVFGLLMVITLISGLVGYALIRVGWEEFDK